MATELLINIVSQATGKGFLESEKAVNKLEKKVKSLGKTLGVSLAAGAALKFSKTFIKAFAEDEKAAVRLNRAVENLGIGFARLLLSLLQT
jgi:phage tail tape-measure protein